MMSKKTIIHIITGDGKGKTTASLGLTLRAIGSGKRVAIIQFMKKSIFSEHKAIRKFKLPILIESFGIGFYKILSDTKTDAQHRHIVAKAWARAKEIIDSKNYDLIILDEINVAISLGLLDAKDVADFINSIKSNNKYFDLVLTGRDASPKLKKIADLISDIKCVKHYFNHGINARKGIEF